MTADSPDYHNLLKKLLAANVPERLAMVAAQDDEPSCLVALAEAAEQLIIDDLGEAMDATQVLVSLADQIDHAQPRVRTRRSAAQALAYASKFDEALAVLDEAEQLAGLGDDPVEGARIEMTRLHALAKLGRYDEAVAAGNAARAVFVAHDQAPLAARADINLGVTHRMRDDPATALRHFDRARPLLLDEPHIVAQLDSNRAEALLDLYRFNDAEQAFREAGEAFQTLQATRASAIVKGNLADLMSRQGRLHDALAHFEQARRLLRDEESPGELARVEAEQAEAFAAAGLLETAVLTYEQAIPRLQNCGLAWDAARALRGLGRSLLELEEYDRAAETLDQAHAAFQALDHQSGCLRVRVLRGVLAWRLHQNDAARAHFAHVLEHTLDASSESIVARVTLGWLALTTDDLDTAEIMITRARAAAEQLQLRPILVELVHAQAVLDWRRGDQAAARAGLRDAVERLEWLRSRFGSDRFRTAFFGSRTDVHETLVDVLTHAGDEARLPEAFQVIEQAKSRSMLDLVHGSVELLDTARRHASDEAEATLIGDAVMLEQELGALLAQCDPLTRTATTDPGTPWQDALSQCERKLEAIEHRLASTRAARVVFAPKVELDQVRSLLHEGETLIDYFVVQDELLALVVQPDRTSVVRELGQISRIAQQIDRFRFQIARATSRLARNQPVTEALTRDAQMELHALHETLVAPLVERPPRPTRYFVAPHGPLHAVPFHALHDGEQHLVEHAAFVQAPSASVLWHLHQRNGTAARAEAPGRSVVVGVSDDIAPRAEQEAALVAALRPGAVFLRGAEATADRLREVTPGTRHLHIACHGRFSRANPQTSGLLLSDGWFAIRDICDLQLRGTGVVLSGCQTGKVHVGLGDELTGLIKAFIVAGASWLVTSLWTLNDESAAEFVAALYRMWDNQGARKGTLGIVSALRDTQCLTLQERPHPVFWSPFVAVGMGR